MVGRTLQDQNSEYEHGFHELLDMHTTAFRDPARSLQQQNTM